jgi:hypothetical protein
LNRLDRAPGEQEAAEAEEKARADAAIGVTSVSAAAAAAPDSGCKEEAGGSVVGGLDGEAAAISDDDEPRLAIYLVGGILRDGSYSNRTRTVPAEGLHWTSEYALFLLLFPLAQLSSSV